jgi:hypothetical protein
MGGAGTIALQLSSHRGSRLSKGNGCDETKVVKHPCNNCINSSANAMSSLLTTLNLTATPCIMTAATAPHRHQHSRLCAMGSHLPVVASVEMFMVGYDN